VVGRRQRCSGRHFLLKDNVVVKTCFTARQLCGWRHLPRC